MAESESFRNLLKQYNLKEEECSKQISDYHFDKISETLCKEWESLPSRLDMPEITISDIKKKFNDEKDRRRALFTKWKARKGSVVTYEKLIRALLDAGCKNDAEGVCKLLQKAIDKPSKISVKSISGPPAISGNMIADPLLVDAVVQEDLKQQLEHNLEEIGRKYASYVSYIYESIKGKISVDTLRIYLLNLPAVNYNKQQDTLLNDVNNELQKANTIEEIFVVLSDHCSFFNYHIYKMIQDQYKIAHSEELSYPDDLEAYVNMHKLSEFVTINPKLANLEKSPSAIATFKFDIPMTSRIAKVIDLKKGIAKILHLKSSSLRLYSVEHGCVEVKFLIPSNVAKCVFKEVTLEQKKEFEALSVISYSCEFSDSDMDEGVQTLEDIRLKIEKLLEMREVTLANLRSLREDIEKSYDKSRKARIAGTTATITGSVLGIVGFGLAFVTFGASLGVTIPGAILAASGGVTVAGAEIGYQVKSKGKLKEANRACSSDLRLMKELGQLGERFGILLRSLAERYETTEENVFQLLKIARPIGGGAYNTYKFIDGFADVGRTIQVAAIAGRVGQATAHTAWAGLSTAARVFGVTGVVFDVVFIPVDLAVLIKSSYDVHKYKNGKGKSASNNAASVQKIISDLEEHRDSIIAAQKTDGDFTLPQLSF